MVYRRLHYVLEHSRKISPTQAGFRKKHDVITQLLRFTDNIRRAMRTRISMAVFRDIKGAYDRVWRNGLRFKLHDHFDIRGNLLRWLSDHLDGRRIRDVVDGVYADE